MGRPVTMLGAYPKPDIYASYLWDTILVRRGVMNFVAALVPARGPCTATTIRPGSAPLPRQTWQRCSRFFVGRAAYMQRSAVAHQGPAVFPHDSSAPLAASAMPLLAEPCHRSMQQSLACPQPLLEVTEGLIGCPAPETSVAAVRLARVNLLNLLKGMTNAVLFGNRARLQPWTFFTSSSNPSRSGNWSIGYTFAKRITPALSTMNAARSLIPGTGGSSRRMSNRRVTSPCG